MWADEDGYQHMNEDEAARAAYNTTSPTPHNSLALDQSPE